ncbi:hypothetical protein TTHERM_001266093 (macronuclear) [Tetrahymena thermophila SB210]|uniref:Uncharacterized protein n=1 Tax=Tetrahymena thermophila (strain SB210) TaxID=312017 RepID=W7WYE4_TETTS|nr:hypothetical protein TTHERM_001266093 [Tetrahymena thermophila SB210]EWS71885.1 hypothetical protein TTHERM_001266093 [Tetrahymena thermophila SB210]|eukprot:XP_012655579.1 hypothetical protein TTHERM_001266093 [Tetrahymena thermophila SB210]
MVQIYTPQILISCHQNGDIIFYDSSKGIQIDLIVKKNYNNQQCLQLERFYDNKIIALMNQSIYLIDPVSQITLNQLTNLTNIVQIVTNYDKLAINYNNCIQIFSSQLVSLFLQCQNEFSSNNFNMSLSNNLQLIIQKSQQISVYQIDLNQQQPILLSTISTVSTIQYINFILNYTSDQNIIINNYFVDEIVIFDNQRSFWIYNSSLNLVHVVNNIQLKAAIIAKRVVNDQLVYFLAGYAIQQGFYTTFLISKQYNKPFMFGISNVYFPQLEEPQKAINSYGYTFYKVKRALVNQLNTLLKEYEIDIQRNITYVSGHEYLYQDYGVTYIKDAVGQKLNQVNYFGTKSGLIFSSKNSKSRYQKLSTEKILKSNNDQIQEIIHSAQIGIVIKSKTMD